MAIKFQANLASLASEAGNVHSREKVAILQRFGALFEHPVGQMNLVALPGADGEAKNTAHPLLVVAFRGEIRKKALKETTERRGR